MLNREEDIMAPKNKFKREEMIAAALKVVRSSGIGSLTAKAIADELGTSTRPVFTCFGTMDTVKNEVRQAAEEIYNGYISAGLKEKIPFFGLGMQYIRFAKEEPELYRLLFLMQTIDGGGGAFQSMLHSQETARPSLVKTYSITEAEADRYFRDLWLVVHSIATLIVTGCCPYSDRELGNILTGFSVSICKSIKEIEGFASDSFDRDKLFKSLTAGAAE